MKNSLEDDLFLFIFLHQNSTSAHITCSLISIKGLLKFGASNTGAEINRFFDLVKGILTSLIQPTADLSSTTVSLAFLLWVLAELSIISCHPQEMHQFLLICWSSTSTSRFTLTGLAVLAYPALSPVMFPQLIVHYYISLTTFKPFKAQQWSYLSVGRLQSHFSCHKACTFYRKNIGHGEGWNLFCSII